MTSLRDTIIEQFWVCVLRIRLVRVGPPTLFYLNHSIRYASSGFEHYRSPNAQREQGVRTVITT